MLSRMAQELLQAARSEPAPLLLLDELSTKRARIWLKREWSDPEGPDPLRTNKRKPASLLLGDALDRGCVGRDEVLLSATSGNFGVELGILANARGVPLFAAVPHDVPDPSLRSLLALGVHVLRTPERSACPGRQTVFFARRCADALAGEVVNLEQYHSWLNPLSHSITTAPELFSGLDRVDYVVASVGSGGTTGGIAQHILSAGRKTRVIGVQAAAGQGVPGTRTVHVRGARGESRWSSENYSPSLLGERYLRTADRVDAYAYTAKLWQLGVPAGPSTGMALAHARGLIEHGTVGDIVVISPDSNFRYGDLISAELDALAPAILSRYPDLALGETLGAYVAHLSNDRGLLWMLARARECYATRTEGRVFEASRVEDLVDARREVCQRPPAEADEEPGEWLRRSPARTRRRLGPPTVGVRRRAARPRADTFDARPAAPRA